MVGLKNMLPARKVLSASVAAGAITYVLLGSSALPGETPLGTAAAVALVALLFGWLMPASLRDGRMRGRPSAFLAS